MNATAAADRDAILLLCTALPGHAEPPLAPGEWGRVSEAVAASGVAGPARLVGLPAVEIGVVLGGDTSLGERIARLLERGGPLALELERLASRGVWVLTPAEEEYPGRLRRRLGSKAPPVLFGAGAQAALDRGGIAIVGSRDASAEASSFARVLAGAAVAHGVPVVSGGARGIDREAMGETLGRGGVAVGVLADSLVRAARQADVRDAIADERLVLVSPYGAEAGFTAGMAMGRNKLIYCLADAAVAVASARGTGGTWAGAEEALKASWVPVWAWAGEGAPEGNRALVELGARPLTDPTLSLAELTASPSVEAASTSPGDATAQPSLFDI